MSSINDSWIRLIKFCQEQLPYGELTIKVVAGSPTVLVSAKPSIRFDKDTPTLFGPPLRDDV